MAKYASKVQETTSSSGTGNLVLTAATAGHRRISDAFAVDDYVHYFLEDANGSAWERGYGQVVAGNQLYREFVEESTNGDAIVNLSNGEHTVTIGAHPDMAKVCGYLTQNSTNSAASGVWTTIAVAGIGLVANGYDTHNAIPGNGPYTNPPIPAWVDKIRVHVKLDSNENTQFGGERRIQIRYLDDTWPNGGMPKKDIPSVTDASANRQVLELISPPIDVPESGGQRGFKIEVWQNSGNTIDLVGYNFVCVEFLE